MSSVAKHINQLSKGAIKPSHITTVSLLGHFFVAWALYSSRPNVAALFIVVFGLMDALDGALARVQNSATKLGMFYDAVTDRFKEIIIYSALIFFTFQHTDAYIWAVPAVMGTSLLVSYVKAKGEMAVSHIHDKQALNRAFSSGFARYEIRMTLLVIGLVTGLLAPMLNLIIALNLATAAMRFIEIAQLLHVEDSQKHHTKVHGKS